MLKSLFHHRVKELFSVKLFMRKNHFSNVSTASFRGVLDSRVGLNFM